MPKAVRPAAYVRPQAPNQGSSRPVRPRDSDAQQDGGLNAGPTRPPPRADQQLAQRPQQAPAPAAAPQYDSRGRKRPTALDKTEGDG